MDAGFRARTATIFLCCQRKMAKETRPKAPASWSAVVRFDNRLDNSSGVYCPRQYTPSSNKSRRLSEVVKVDNT
jgi:hypothetical protein